MAGTLTAVQVTIKRALNLPHLTLNEPNLRFCNTAFTLTAQKQPHMQSVPAVGQVSGAVGGRGGGGGLYLLCLLAKCQRVM